MFQGVQDLFRELNKRGNFTVKLKTYEIYCEKIYDLNTKKQRTAKSELAVKECINTR